MSKRNSSTAPRGAQGHPDNVTATNRGRLVMATALAAVVSVGGLVYVTQVESGGNALATGSSAALPPRDFPDPGVVHVHGLGVDPADGAVYAATHSGLFRLPEGEGKPTRVANRYQDTMGFSVVGPHTFPRSSPRQRHRQRLSPRSGVRMRA